MLAAFNKMYRACVKIKLFWLHTAVSDLVKLLILIVFLPTSETLCQGKLGKEQVGNKINVNLGCQEKSWYMPILRLCFFFSFLSIAMIIWSQFFNFFNFSLPEVSLLSIFFKASCKHHRTPYPFRKQEVSSGSPFFFLANKGRTFLLHEVPLQWFPFRVYWFLAWSLLGFDFQSNDRVK